MKRSSLEARLLQSQRGSVAAGMRTTGQPGFVHDVGNGVTSCRSRVRQNAGATCRHVPRSGERGRISTWLKPNGKRMVHIFCHARYAYPFKTEGEANWMGRYFFTGGIMPSDDLLLHFQRDLVLEDH